MKRIIIILVLVLILSACELDRAVEYEITFQDGTTITETYRMCKAEGQAVECFSNHSSLPTDIYQNVISVRQVR